MRERVVYLSGRLVPESQAAISVFDRGVQWGDAVYDAARTFNHRPFKLREHIDRLYRSCRYTRMPIRLTPEAMEQHTLQVIEHNMPLLGPNDDDMIWWTVTRGVNPLTRSVLDCHEATVIICTFPVPFRAFAKWMTRGARVVTPSVRRTPPQCLDFFVRQGQLCTPAAHNILEGITRATIVELARSLGTPVVEGDFTVYDVYTAEEAFLATTTYSILPVAQLNGAPIGQTAPGPLTRRLIEAWNALVGVDIVAQALSHLELEPLAVKR